MTKQEMQKKIAAAQVAGTIAFGDGRKCVPALDKNFDKIDQGLQVGEGIEVIQAWIKGWTLANLTV